MLYVARLMQLPPTVKGFVVQDAEVDDFYNIYINDRLSPREQSETLDHEVRHIKEGDLQDGNIAMEVENGR